MNQSDFYIGAFLSKVVRKGRVALIETVRDTGKLFLVETNGSSGSVKFYVKYSATVRPSGNNQFWQFTINEQEMEKIKSHSPNICLVCGDPSKLSGKFGYLCLIETTWLDEILELDSLEAQSIRVVNKPRSSLRVSSSKVSKRIVSKNALDDFFK